MSYEHRAVVEAPPADVWAWHARPGAMRRLTPPWPPVRVATEADSLRDGVAELALPAGLRWEARHRPDGYREGSRFTDELTTPLLAPLLAWRHEHEFAPAGAGRTEVVDRVTTRVPGRFLAELFAYRTDQLRGDLAGHTRWTTDPLTVAVTGSSGLIGTALVALLTSGGHRVVRLVRHAAGPGERRWDPAAPAPGLLEGVDAVVHLAGASIAGRFTAAHKRAVRDSRIGPTRSLAEVAARCRVPVWVGASAVGVYGADRGDEILDEGSDRGEGFLADVVADWEADAAAAGEAGARVVLVRTGIVQTPAGGSLRLLRPLFEAGLGGRLGDGRQWLPWIGLDDLLDVYLRALVDPALEGPVNAVAPEPVRNAAYTQVLARVLRRPAVLPVPDLGPRLLLGSEGVSEVAAASQRVVPARLDALGHPWRHPELEAALRHVLGRTRGAGRSATGG